MFKKWFTSHYINPKQFTNHFQGSSNPALIQKRLIELQQLQRSLTSKQYPGAPIRRGPAKQIVAPPGSTSLDHRPTAIQVSGFNAEDADALLGHFKHFGEITKHQVDRNVPSLIIAYTTRLNAEQALGRGRQFKDKQLQVRKLVKKKIWQIFSSI